MDEKPALKHHITATISERAFKALEEYRETHKDERLPDRSQIVEDAILAYVTKNDKLAIEKL